MQATRNYERGNSPLRLLLVLLAIALAALAIPPIIQQSHAAAHSEASTIRSCAANPENWAEIWINNSLERLNCLIKLDDGSVGNYVLQPTRRGVLEVTAYILGGGTLLGAIAILKRKGCKRIYPPEN